MRNAKDTAHTKAERNILEGVKVIIVQQVMNRFKKNRKEKYETKLVCLKVASKFC